MKLVTVITIITDAYTLLDQILQFHKMHIARSFSTCTEIYLINKEINVVSVTLDGRYDEIS